MTKISNEIFELVGDAYRCIKFRLLRLFNSNLFLIPVAYNNETGYVGTEVDHINVLNGELTKKIQGGYLTDDLFELQQKTKIERLRVYHYHLPDYTLGILKQIQDKKLKTD